jgi:hypothetical protein
MTPNAEFHMYVGLCITAWAKVEEQLFRMCARCLGTSDELAAIVYYRTPNMDTRLKLVDELLRAVLPKRKRKSGGHDHPDVKKWNTLRSNLEDLLGRGAVSRIILLQPATTLAAAESWD